MTDQPRKDQTKDLPPKKVTTRDEENVRGGAEPVGRPKPADPVNRNMK